MPKEFSHKQNCRIIALMILLALFACSLLMSCDITKQATKTKTATDTQNKIEEATKNKVVDFSKVESNDLTLTYEPYDTTKAMRIVDSKGDSINAFNTKITSKKTTKKTNKNIVSESENELKDNSIIKEDNLQKESKKEENFDASAILYAFIGLAIFVVIALTGIGVFVKIAMGKQTKLLETLVKQRTP